MSVKITSLYTVKIFHLRYENSTGNLNTRTIFVFKRGKKSVNFMKSSMISEKSVYNFSVLKQVLSKLLYRNFNFVKMALTWEKKTLLKNNFTLYREKFSVWVSLQLNSQYSTLHAMGFEQWTFGFPVLPTWPLSFGYTSRSCQILLLILDTFYEPQGRWEKIWKVFVVDTFLHFYLN